MSSVANSTSPTNSVTDALSITNRQQTTKKSNELGQSAFLELMITQMNNQNPLDPQDNTAFVAQLAQFSQVEGLARLNENFSSFMSNNALQASSLVGRNVTVDSETSMLTNGGIVSGSVNLDYSTTDLNINVYDEAGSLVQQIPVGSAPQGENVFRWDGQNIEFNGDLLDWDAGDNAASAGKYRFEVLATQNGEKTAVNTSLSANINSVSIGDDGSLILNLAGVGAVNVSEVKQFN